MNRFIIELAGLPIEIVCESDFTYKQCENYLLQSEEPVVTARGNEAEIIYNVETVPMQRDVAESFSIYKSIAEQLTPFNRFVFHGAAISYGGRGYIFTAASGTGKTTHIKLWKRCLGAPVDIINGDKPIISVENGVTVHGTPWAGKEGWNKNRSAPLGGICIIERGRVNKIRKLSPDECLKKILPQIYIPKNKASAGQILSLLDGLLKAVPVYLLSCDISEEAVRCSFEAMTGLSFDENRV